MGMKLFFFAILAVGSLFAARADGVAPLDNREEFLYGPLRAAEGPPREGAIPGRLEALPFDRSPLPDGIWLRFQNLGGGRYQHWSAQMQIGDEGNLYLVAHFGDATADKTRHPAWPAAPSQKLDRKTLEAVRRKALAFIEGPPYRGHEGLPHAPVFLITVKEANGKERSAIAEGWEEECISHLRRISAFASGKTGARSRSSVSTADARHGKSGITGAKRGGPPTAKAPMMKGV